MRTEEGPRSKALHSPARRHFFHIVAAAASCAAVAGLSTGARANYKSRFPPQNPGPEPGPNPNTACFLRGTPILTPAGEVPVEALSIGDRVLTVSGESRPIKWIGQRTYRESATARWPETIEPIRVARSALADNVPNADLYVSPLHALYLDGVLIPVMHLVNGTTIRPGMPDGMQDIEYFHIELETHDVVLAAGAPAETYREFANREIFGNFAEYYRLYGRNEETIPPACAPYLHYSDARAHLKALLRLGVSRVVDVRDPIQVARDRLATRAAALAL